MLPHWDFVFFHSFPFIVFYCAGVYCKKQVLKLFCVDYSVSYPQAFYKEVFVNSSEDQFAAWLKERI